ncbi:MAG TPA: hypothetical protein VGO31_09360 [Microbacteriaceae bacterium]|nr:hypothetical protein [Microbacteriaceae bacterium]
MGIGTGVLTGSGVALCEIAGSGGVGPGLGEPVMAGEFAAGAPDVAARGEWLRVTCAAAFLPTGTHPASTAVTATVMPIAANLRLHVELVAASALSQFSLPDMIPPNRILGEWIKIVFRTPAHRDRLADVVVKRLWRSG